MGSIITYFIWLVIRDLNNSWVVLEWQLLAFSFIWIAWSVVHWGVVCFIVRAHLRGGEWNCSRVSWVPSTDGTCPLPQSPSRLDCHRVPPQQHNMNIVVSMDDVHWELYPWHYNHEEGRDSEDKEAGHLPQSGLPRASASRRLSWPSPRISILELA